MSKKYLELLKENYKWCISVIHNGYGYFHLYDTEEQAQSEFNWRVQRSEEGEHISVCMSETKKMHFTNISLLESVIMFNRDK